MFFFLVPTGRGQTADLITAQEFEMLFEKLYQTSARVKFDIKTTEAQHYRRFLLQRRPTIFEMDPTQKYVLLRLDSGWSQ